jgi:hypothetical protein
VHAFSLPQCCDSQSEKWFSPGYFSLPMNTMCSRKCEMPSKPEAWSAKKPTLKSTAHAASFMPAPGESSAPFVIVIVVVSIRLLVFFFLLILGFLFLLVVALILGGGLHASLRVWEEDKGSGGRREASVRGASFAVS